MFSLSSDKKNTLDNGSRVILGTTFMDAPLPALRFDARPLPELAVGTELGRESGKPLLKILSRIWWPDTGGGVDPVYLTAVCQAMDIGPDSESFTSWKSGFTLAWITLSDKGYAGSREDMSGPLIEKLVGEKLPLAHALGHLLPDEVSGLKALLTNLALEQKADLVITTGGTGLTRRDVAPEATLAVIEKRLAGMEQAMVQSALDVTPHGMLSRAVAGTLGQCLIINLPGSPKAVRENLGAILPALEHALKKLHDDPSDCAR